MAAELATLQKQLQKEIKNRSTPLFLQTHGSVWSSTKLPVACFSVWALAIYLLDNAGLGAQAFL